MFKNPISLLLISLYPGEYSAVDGQLGISQHPPTHEYHPWGQSFVAGSRGVGHSPVVDLFLRAIGAALDEGGGESSDEV